MDNMLKTSGNVEQVKPGGLEYVDARLQALWIAADICGICEYTYEAGPLRLIHFIKDRREKAHDKYTFTIRIDAALRKAIYQNNYNDRSTHKTCSQAILAVLGTNPALPSEADRVVEQSLHEIIITAGIMGVA